MMTQLKGEGFIDHVDTIEVSKNKLRKKKINSKKNLSLSSILCSKFIRISNLPDTMRQFEPLLKRWKDSYQSKG